MILGFVLLYFIGKYFYKLAEEFNKNKWLYAILGIVVYYAGIFLGGILLALMDLLIGFNFNWESNLMLGLIVLPFGLGAAYLFYYILKKQWKKSFVVVKDEIQEIGKTLE